MACEVLNRSIPIAVIAFLLPGTVASCHPQSPERDHTHTHTFTSMVKSLSAATHTGSFDGAPLSKLANRVPGIKKTGVLVADNRLQMERSAMVKIIDAMCKQPKVIMPLFGYLEANDLQKEQEEVEKASRDSDAWRGGYKQIDRIPRGWKSEWLLQHAKAAKIDRIITADYLSKVALADSDGVSVIFAMATQLLGTMSVPEPMQNDSRIMSLALTKRAESRGAYLTNFAKAGGFAAAQSLMTLVGQHGCFRLKFTEGYLSSVEHITGVAGAVPAHLQRTITQEFALLDNHLDHAARLELAPSQYFLKDFFGGGAKFKEDIVAKGKKSTFLAGLATVAANEIAAKDMMASSAEVDGCDRVYQEVKKQQREAAMTKAREALQRKRTDRMVKRTFQLST